MSVASKPSCALAPNPTMKVNAMMFAIFLYGAMALTGRAQDISDHEAYAKAAAAAGKDPVAHVRLALWCEAHDLPKERLDQLKLAVKYDPSYGLARGLLGLVAFRDQWGQPEEIVKQIRDDPAGKALLSEYLERRSQTPEKADALLKLAAWCDERGLPEQAAVHYKDVIKLDPARELAWRHLGFKKQGKYWVKPENLAAAKQNLSHQKLADRSWKTKLEKLRDGLQSKDAARRARSEEELAVVTDPRAVPMIWAVFVRSGARQQKAAVAILGQIDGPGASNGLAAIAVFSSFPDVRSRAIDALKRRDPRDVVRRLIAMVHKPYKYEVRPSRSPSSPGDLVVLGEKSSGRWFYQNTFADSEVMASLSAGRLATDDVPFDPFSLRNMMTAALGVQYQSLKSQFGQEMGLGGMRAEFPITINPPLSPASTTQAVSATISNPQNAGSILNQLMTDPDNRTMPPLLWYVLANQNTVLDHTEANPVNRNVPSALALRPVDNPTRNAPPIEFFRPADQNGHPVDPQQAAQALNHRDKIANNPANLNTNLAWDLMIQAQGAAAQRDMDIANDILAARQAKLTLQQKLAMDIQIIEAINGGITMTNLRVLPVLTAITGQDFGVEPEKWKSWWITQLGYGRLASAKGAQSPGAQPDARGSHPVAVAALASDTVVHTTLGPRPINSINVGDRVLSQDTTSGKLSYQPVAAVSSHPSAETLKVRAGGQSIAATGLLRFWRPGKGWAMARDLKPGDRLRVAGDVVEVETVEPDTARAVCNLVVAEGGDIFVGTNKFLVHDGTVVRPVLEPFDRTADLIAPKGTAK
jgi:tetratricopeptide (TPR) repeat protein